MELTKAEHLIIVSAVIYSIGTECAISLLGEDTVSKLDVMAVGMVGNATPNEMESIGPIAISKLVHALLEMDTDDGLPIRFEGSD